MPSPRGQATGDNSRNCSEAMVVSWIPDSILPCNEREGLKLEAEKNCTARGRCQERVLRLKWEESESVDSIRNARTSLQIVELSGVQGTIWS